MRLLLRSSSFQQPPHSAAVEQTDRHTPLLGGDGHGCHRRGARGPHTVHSSIYVYSGHVEHTLTVKCLISYVLIVLQRLWIPFNNIVSLVQCTAFHPATHQQSKV